MDLQSSQKYQPIVLLLNRFLKSIIFSDVLELSLSNHIYESESGEVPSMHNQGGFHLQLLVFPFVYQFNSRIGVLVNSSFAEGFQQRFSIISKSVCCGFYMKKTVDFTLISFAVLK